jgi:hypothetical protein
MCTDVYNTVVYVCALLIYRIIYHLEYRRNNLFSQNIRNSNSFRCVQLYHIMYGFFLYKTTLQHDRTTHVYRCHVRHNIVLNN